MICRRCTFLGTAVLLAGLLTVSLVSGGPAAIRTEDLKTWLTVVASDEMEGRATYSAGLGLTAGYIQEHLRAWGVVPAGDNGTYIQTVRVRGVRSKSRSKLIVRVGRQTRTFKDGAGVTFPENQGASRTLTIDRVEFGGYGLEAPAVRHSDFTGRDLRGAALVFLGRRGPKSLEQEAHRRLLAGRSRYAIDQLAAGATLGPPLESAGRSGDEPADASASAPDFTTAQRLDQPLPPAVTASDELFAFLFSRAPESYEVLRRKAEAQEPLPPFTLNDVSLTFEIDAEYQVVRTQLTQNVVGIVEGSDPELRRSYVAFGAHYDHVGYAQYEVDASNRRARAPGLVTEGASGDRVWNGADDNGSGTVALMAVAKAFAEASRPRRSLLFVWHAGEERGLWGSRYFVDHPTVPLESIVAQLNVDMIGRNRDDRAEEADTVYLVGSDRISTELHEINREANRALPRPLTLDYAMNDPSDLEQIYFRSDHYSYAAKGIPVIFFTTGLHPDYHANTDHVDKIEFDKLTRIAQLLFETGARLANRERPPARDNQGPRAGKGTLE